MSLRFQPDTVGTGSDDTESQLVVVDSFLVAVLERLSDEHAADAGKWFLRVGFDRVDDLRQPKFADLDEARAWIVDRLS